MLIVLVLAFAFVRGVLAAPTERILAPPAGFARVSVAPPSTILNLRLNLASNDLLGLEDALTHASDPADARYGLWLTREEVNNFLRPSNASQTAVFSWLARNGLSSTAASAAGDWLSISMSVEKAGAMFDAEFAVFEHQASGRKMVRALEYTVPAEVAEHVRVVHPITSFTDPLRRTPLLSPPPAVTPPASCNASFTPTCLQDLYNIPAAPATNASNGIGVAGFIDEFANKMDLEQFLEEVRPDIPRNTSFGFQSVDGGLNNQTRSEAGGEASLDIQYTVGIATEVPVTFVSVGETTQDGDDSGFLDIITALLNSTAPPPVFTCSYGLETEASLTPAMTRALCDAYMALTARGVSILFATGDGGVAANPGVNCTPSAFAPTFPTCPFITLVGATQDLPEVGAGLSAGGFSNVFPRTDFQDTAVSAYLNVLGDEFAGAFNRSGRAYPDVSAAGARIPVVIDGANRSSGGTSSASPIFASVVALLNDELLNAGRPVLGFLNPWLYAHPEMFNDITAGSNPGCGTSGFPAAKGWDPVTGLGSPNYTAMRIAAGLA